MKIKESVLREKISRILSEDFRYQDPYGKNYTISDKTASLNKGLNLTLSSATPENRGNILRITQLIDALTSPQRQNVAAWRYVAEMLLLNLPESSDLNSSQQKSLPYIFGDVKIGNVICSVKSSFQETVNRWEDVVGQVGLHPRSLYTSNGVFKSNVFKGAAGAMIFCFRKDRQSLPGEDVFSIEWYMTDPVPAKDIDERARKIGLDSSPRKTRSVLKINEIFGAPKLLFACTFTDLSSEINDADRAQLFKFQELEKLIDSLTDEQLSKTINYVNSLIQQSS